jgi:hypothetical protein
LRRRPLAFTVTVMRARRLVPFVLGVVLAVAPAASAFADADARGGCDGGPATWRLRVQREDARHLRVRYEVRSGDDGDRWHVFVSDNGVRVFAQTRTADDSGTVSLRIVIADRPRRDRIAASAVDLDHGQTCSGSVRF